MGVKLRKMANYSETGSRKKAMRDIKRKEKKIKKIKKHFLKLRTRTTYS